MTRLLLCPFSHWSPVSQETCCWRAWGSWCPRFISPAVWGAEQRSEVTSKERISQTALGMSANQPISTRCLSTWPVQGSVGPGAKAHALHLRDVKAITQSGVCKPLQLSYFWKCFLGPRLSEWIPGMQVFRT